MLLVVVVVVVVVNAVHPRANIRAATIHVPAVAPVVGDGNQGGGDPRPQGAGGGFEGSPFARQAQVGVQTAPFPLQGAECDVEVQLEHGLQFVAQDQDDGESDEDHDGLEPADIWPVGRYAGFIGVGVCCGDGRHGFLLLIWMWKCWGAKMLQVQ